MPFQVTLTQYLAPANDAERRAVEVMQWVLDPTASPHHMPLIETLTYIRMEVERVYPVPYPNRGDGWPIVSITSQEDGVAIMTLYRHKKGHNPGRQDVIATLKRTAK